MQTESFSCSYFNCESLCEGIGKDFVTWLIKALTSFSSSKFGTSSCWGALDNASATQRFFPGVWNVSKE